MKTRLVILFPLLLLINACVHPIKPMAIESASNKITAIDVEASYWWRYVVKLSWPQDQEPAWHMDLLLADQLFAPTLREFSSQLPLWRFHRRASRDNAGHQFSFLFFSNVELANKVYASIDQQYEFLRNIGLTGIDSVAKTESSTLPTSGIASSSDQRWPVEIQETWPYFIKGVCESWLLLLQQIVKPELSASDMANFATLNAIYQSAETQVNALWQQQGGHAYLHHLNAVFGYQSVIITERKLMNF